MTINPQIEEFSTSLVIELANISRAIYPGPTNQKQLKLLGQKIQIQHYIHGSYGRGYCRIFANEMAVVVAFRGTRERVDWKIANIRALPVPLRDCGLKRPVLVHTGFQTALDFIDKTSGQRSYSAILSRLDNIELGQRELYITGHSLGGAIATLFASKLRNARPDLVKNSLRGIVTFGAPASGSLGFYRHYGELNKLTLRLVNASDAVPFTPPIGYRHVGKSAWLLNKSISEDPGWKTRLRLSLSILSPSAFVRHHSMSEYVAALKALTESTQ